jgi:aminodeoxyfutalosine synthase
MTAGRANAQTPYWENTSVTDEDTELAIGDPRRVTWHAGVRVGPYVPGIDAQIDMVERAQRLQDRAGGFRAFAPLPRSVSITQPTTGYADLKLIAVARIVASNIDSIQVDWPLYGPKLAQVALTVGANDVDGVLAVEPGVLGTRRSAIEEIKNKIRAAALDAVERNGRFEQLS